MKPWLLLLIFAVAAFGASASHSLWAVPNENLITICHHAGTENDLQSVVIYVPENALQGHLGHGDCVLYDQNIPAGTRHCHSNWCTWSGLAPLASSVPTAAMPEPSNLALAMVAVVGLGFYGWGGRRRRNSTSE